MGGLAISGPNPESFGASYGMLLGLTFIAILIAFLTKAYHSDWSSNCRKIAAVLICIITMLFLICVSALSAGLAINTSSDICQAVYIVTAVFWLAGKGLLYLWFGEKLHTHWHLLELSKSRWNVVYFANNVVVLAPYTLALVWIFGVYDAIIPQPSGICHIGMSYPPAAGYLLGYTVLLSLYISLSFLWPYLYPEQQHCINSFPSHPAVRIPPSKRKRQGQQTSAAIYAALNLLTSFVPAGVLLRMLVVPTGMPWSTFASIAAADLTLAAAVVAGAGYMERDRNRGVVAGERWEVPRTEVKLLCDDCATMVRRGSGVLQWFTPNL